MLTNYRYHDDEDTDFIHNYYERVVLEEIYKQSHRVQKGDKDFLADEACVALNRMPPRYIRHDVDMTFFMSPQDMQEIENKVIRSVTEAIAYVESRERGENPKLAAVEVSLIANRANKPVKTKMAEKNPAAAASPSKPKSTKK